MYPLKFEPILKQTLWGGDKIIPFKHLNESLQNVGESWEVSAVEGSESVVANGPDKGLTLPEMVRKYKEELVGEANYARFGEKFPLLIKFIDAKLDVCYLDEHHIRMGDARIHCTGPRIHLRNTGDIQFFAMAPDFVYDPVRRSYLLVGVVSKPERLDDLSDINKF